MVCINPDRKGRIISSAPAGILAGRRKVAGPKLLVLAVPHRSLIAGRGGGTGLQLSRL
jgi:hypothetical protein